MQQNHGHSWQNIFHGSSLNVTEISFCLLLCRSEVLKFKKITSSLTLQTSFQGQSKFKTQQVVNIGLILITQTKLLKLDAKNARQRSGCTTSQLV